MQQTGNCSHSDVRESAWGSTLLHYTMHAPTSCGFLGFLEALGVLHGQSGRVPQDQEPTELEASLAEQRETSLLDSMLGKNKV